jgi:hypothetical protein
MVNAAAFFSSYARRKRTCGHSRNNAATAASFGSFENNGSSDDNATLGFAKSVFIDDLDDGNDVEQMQKDYAKFHRSGWSYAMSNLREALHVDKQPHLSLHDAESSSSAVIRFDYYVDRTFHWKRDELIEAGKLPRSSDVPWAGVVHHTFDTGHSRYNCVEMLADPVFRNSLRSCVALFTLSEHLADRLRVALDGLDLSFSPPSVIAVTHPTEFLRREWHYFTAKNFWENPDRALIQVGAWLRDPYAIYDLNVEGGILAPRDVVVRLRKAALCGRNMGQYFPPSDFGKLELHMRDKATREYLKFDGEGGEKKIVDTVQALSCPPADIGSVEYAFGESLVEFLSKHNDSVQMIPRQDDKRYDALLSKNAVFLKLVDASAVNTVIECIVRNTPVFVNRLPAVEEALGRDYPGFYESLKEAAVLVTRYESYERMERYLVAMDKKKFMVEAFVRAVHDGLVRVVKKCI